MVAPDPATGATAALARQIAHADELLAAYPDEALAIDLERDRLTAAQAALKRGTLNVREAQAAAALASQFWNQTELEARKKARARP